MLNIHQSEDDRLIKDCLRNDPKAQERLFTKYSSRLYGLCRRYIREESEAEDVMITAFAKIFQKIDQYKAEGSFEGWMRRIAVNEALTYIRRNKSIHLEVDIEVADEESSLEHMGHELEAKDLLAMIDQLPAGYRTVFNLYAIEGYAHKEIAVQLGISENTSKSQLSRARGLLQKYLKHRELSTKKKFS